MKTENKFWFDCKIKYDNGGEKPVKEEYLVEALSFAEAETRLIEKMTPYMSGEYDVTAVKKQGQCEIFYSDNDNAGTYYQCKVGYITIDEKSGAEKQTMQTIFVVAADFDDAVRVLKEGLKDTMSDWVLSSVGETAIMDSFKMESNDGGAV